MKLTSVRIHTINENCGWMKCDLVYFEYQDELGEQWASPNIYPGSLTHLFPEQMTPRAVLDTNAHQPAQMIVPGGPIFDFDSVLENREQIRNLELLPIKSAPDREVYKKNSASLVQDVERMVGSSSVKIIKNAFPYVLPKDVNQELIWVRDGTLDQQIFEVLEAHLLQNLKNPRNVLDVFKQVVMFERPKKSDCSLVEGTFPHMRHIHLWTRK